MCRRIDPELQKQFIREVAEEFRRWFRKWRRRITATGGLSLQRSAPTPTDTTRTKALTGACGTDSGCALSHMNGACT